MPEVPDAIVLCGGAGLRLKTITGDAPKSMAVVAGRPFLELLLRQLRQNGVQRVILAVGYQKQVIRSYFGNRMFDLEVAYSEESTPLGTGGALRNAVDLITTDAALILNGDSYTGVNLAQFIAAHEISTVDASVVLSAPDERDDCGNVAIDNNDMVVSFVEKKELPGQRRINAGIYMVARSLLHEIPVGVPVSLERDLFPRWLEQGRKIKGFVYAGSCTDIGTPDRYRIAQQILADLELEAASQERS